MVCGPLGRHPLFCNRRLLPAQTRRADRELTLGEGRKTEPDCWGSVMKSLEDGAEGVDIWTEIVW
jgi:hypothetical protein